MRAPSSRRRSSMRSYPRSIWRTLPISLRPSAHSAAISMAMPARMSGESSFSPRSRRGPSTIARCGSHMVTSAPMRTSLSVKIRRFSNIHSWIRTEPSLWVARAAAMLVRSAGKAGHGPSCTLALCSPTSRRMARRWLPGTTTSSPSSSECRPSRSKTMRIIWRSAGRHAAMRSSPPVTPASAMNDAISMWSGPTSCSQPRRRSTPLTVRRLEPIPWMSAPIFTSRRAGSCTGGSHAALCTTVAPGVSAAAISTFSVAITEGSSMNTSPARRPPVGAVIEMSLPKSKSAPSALKASTCGSSRRRPMTSPPGGGIRALPKRARSGPATRKDARMNPACSRSTAVRSTPPAQRTSSLAPRQSTRTPRSRSSASIDSTSRIRGTLRSTTSSSVRTEAARMGSAAFLLPAGTTVPDSGAPPSMTNFSMRGRRFGGAEPAAPERWARVTAMALEISREASWTLLCEWTESDSLLRHMLAVEAAMRAYARRFDEDEDLGGTTGLLHDLDYERYPSLEDGHPRHALRELEARGYPAEVVRGVASHADFLGVPREPRMEQTLYAVDELCGFLLALAYVRPDGLHGMTPKSVKKKLKQPSFAAAVDRDDLRSGAEELRVDFDEHLAFVIAALEEHADELVPARTAG